MLECWSQKVYCIYTVNNGATKKKWKPYLLILIDGKKIDINYSIMYLIKTKCKSETIRPATVKLKMTKEIIFCHLIFALLKFHKEKEYYFIFDP